MAYTAERKNLRVCQVLRDSSYYDVIVAVDTLDDVDDALNDWALQEFGEISGGEQVLVIPLDLPAALIYCKDITQVITSLNIDNYGYMVPV